MPDLELSEVHRTAFQAAALRAGHFIQGAEPKIFRDQYALSLTQLTEEEAVASINRVPKSSAATCVLRSRFTEDRLAVAKGRLNQYVILGAGLDSYALRMGDQLGSLIVYEVDDPPLQKWKRERIAALGLSVSKQVRYVPCDFERMSIEQALSNGGFHADEPCFVSWLGVTQYLTREAIRETLQWAGRRAAGSEIVLTIVEPGAEEERRSTTRLVVPFISYFSVDEISEMLRDAGFSRIEPLTKAMTQERYLQLRSDALMPPEFQRVVAAIV
jgi:methyltransferase (TIGR00027 family)